MLWRDSKLSCSTSLSECLHNYHERFSMNIKSKNERRWSISFFFFPWIIVILYKNNRFLLLRTNVLRWILILWRPQVIPFFFSREAMTGRSYRRRKRKERISKSEKNIRVDCISFRSTRRKYNLENVFAILHRKWIIFLLLLIIKRYDFFRLIRLISRLDDVGLDETARTTLDGDDTLDQILTWIRM